MYTSRIAVVAEATVAAGRNVAAHPVAELEATVIHFSGAVSTLKSDMYKNADTAQAVVAVCQDLRSRWLSGKRTRNGMKNVSKTRLLYFPLRSGLSTKKLELIIPY